MSFRLNNPPFRVDLTKKTGLGPRVSDSKKIEGASLEAKEDADGVSTNINRKVMTDGSATAGFNARNGAKSDAQKKVISEKKKFDAMSDAEKKAAQDAANAKRKAFENSDEYKARKARTSSLPFMGNLKIEKVSKNSINIPNINKNNNTEAFVNPPYRDPNSTGPRVKRKGYHGWKKTEK